MGSEKWSQLGGLKVCGGGKWHSEDGEATTLGRVDSVPLQ